MTKRKSATFSRSQRASTCTTRRRSNLEREELLPGFVEGHSRIHHDEQRHIGYGIWYLRQAIRVFALNGLNRRPSIIGVSLS